MPVILVFFLYLQLIYIAEVKYEWAMGIIQSMLQNPLISGIDPYAAPKVPTGTFEDIANPMKAVKRHLRRHDAKKGR